VLGLLTDEPEESGESVLGYPILGTIHDLEEVVQEHPVDEVIFTVSPDELAGFEGHLVSLQELGILVRFALKPHPVAIGTIELGDLEGVPVISYAPPPAGNVWLQLKRLTDVVAASVLLALWAPFVVLIALVIKIVSGGPVLFRQTRVGLNGRQFTLYKFRTMVEGAERRQAELAHLNVMSGPVFKSANDPRVTRFGALLRRHSLDELPQLWNVLKGEMSLVGPRPPLPEEVAQYERWQKRRLSMRPGLTCLWQVSGRNRIDFDRWMELDLEYIDNWSPRLDLKILLRTIPAVLGGSGAH
jgi:exopolysaccharide biosynthesis polyprenyl glycosylphosphotransferase